MNELKSIRIKQAIEALRSKISVDGRLSARPYQIGDPLPAVGSPCLVSCENNDIHGDQHRSYMWRQVVGYTDDVLFVCLQTFGCWPTTHRLENCWFAEIPVTQPQTQLQQASALEWLFRRPLDGQYDARFGVYDEETLRAAGHAWEDIEHTLISDERVDSAARKKAHLKQVAIERAIAAHDHTIDEDGNYVPVAVQDAPTEPPATEAARDVLAERQRQINAEGWTPEHDDEHSNGELARAAACYAIVAKDNSDARPPTSWPWSRSWWKPSDRRRNLVKAGALILAEIERLDRRAARRQAMFICPNCEHPETCRDEGCYEL